MFEDTARFWKSWLARSTYTGRWRESLERSAITLKLMTYAPTGGLVAAPTAGTARAGRRRAQLGLPLHLGPRRLVLGLRAAGHGLHRGGRRVRQLAARPGRRAGRRRDGPAEHHVPRRRLLGPDRGDPRALGGLPRVLRPCGSATAPPASCSSTSTARRSTASTSPTRRGLPVGHQGWVAIRGMLDWLCDHWDQPEEGIWETRGGQKDFTYGRVMSWVALDRGAAAGRRARATGAGGAAGRPQRDAIYDQIMERGWNAERRAFVQHYDDRVLDSSLLRMARVGFISPHDPMWASTLRRDGRGAGHRQPGLPLRPERLARRAPRLGGHLLAVHVRLRRRAGAAPDGSTRRGWSSRRCSPTPTTSACSPRRSA